MKHLGFSMLTSKITGLVVLGAVSAFGLSDSARADCIVGPSDPSSFTLLIDATSSCANLSGNMYGCDIDASGSCTITNPNTNESITVTLTRGAVGGTTPVDWSSASLTGNLVDFAIIVGANAGGTCGTNYVPGSDFGTGLAFQKSNGSVQKMGSISLCSDFIEPITGTPRLLLKKTVTTADDETCSSSSELLEVKAGDSVKYCYSLENVGAGLAEGVTLNDDAGTQGDPGDDFVVTLNGLNNDGSLSSGGTATGSELATITGAGTLVNTATAMATGPDGVVIATDTATVNAVLAAEICPDNFQDAVNQLSLTTGLDFAYLLDPNQDARRAVCVPNGESGAADTIRIACQNQCITKPVCETNPDDPQCTPSVCEPSGAWTVKDENGICSVVTNPPPGAQPYCYEVLQDVNKDCTLNEWDPQEESVLHIKKGHVNPYVWQSCYSSGGRYVCETMCFLYPGEDPSDCPPGSTVF